MTPSVAILVLNWNGWGDTIECLESLYRLDYPNFQVVLCDNASSDDSVAHIMDWAAGKVPPTLTTPAELRHLVDPPVRKPISTVRYSREEAEAGPPPSDASLIIINNGSNAGFAGGTNIGLRYLYTQPQLDYVWILNNDIIVAPTSLSRLMDSAKTTPSLGGVGPTLFEYKEPAVVQAAGGGTFNPWRGFPRAIGTANLEVAAGQPLALDYVAGGCMVAPLRTLAKIGTFDEGYFMYGEDVDLSQRIMAAGLTLAYVPMSHVWHKGGAAVGYQSPRHDYYAVRNNLFLIKKYHPRFLPLALALSLYMFVLPKIARRQWKRLGAVRQAIADFRNGVVGPLPAASPFNQR